MINPKLLTKPSRLKPTIILPYIQPEKRFMLAHTEINHILGSCNLDNSLYSSKDYLDIQVEQENQNQLNQEISSKR